MKHHGRSNRERLLMSNDCPLVSVILCNYNYGRFMGEAIDSVLAQTYIDFELIVVDDGSTDESREVISSCTDPRIRTIFHDRNRGQAAAFNSGFAAVNGEIVAFLDSDDWWKPEKLKTVVNWDRFLQGEYALIQHSLDVWIDGRVEPYKVILPTGDCFAEMQRSGQIDFFVPTSGLCFRRTVLERVFPIPVCLTICADAYLTRTAFTSGKVYSIPDSIGFYRRHKNQVWGNDSFDVSLFLDEVLFPALSSFYQNNGISYQLARNRKKRQMVFQFARKWLNRFLRFPRTSHDIWYRSHDS